MRRVSLSRSGDAGGTAGSPAAREQEVKSAEGVGELACRCVPATLGLPRGGAKGRGEGEGGAASKAGSPSLRPGELCKEAGAGRR